MDYNDQSPRRPRDSRQRAPTADSYNALPPQTPPSSRPQRSTMPQPTPLNAQNVSFQEPERSWRSPPPPSHSNTNTNQRPTYDHAYSKTSSVGTPGANVTEFTDPEAQAAGGGGAFSDSNDFRRKKSLIRPDREKIDPSHRQWHYRNHAAQMEEEQYQDPSAVRGLAVGPSTTGNVPQTGLRRGKSLLARDEDVQETRLNMFTRSAGATLRRKRHQPAVSATGSNAMGPAPEGPPVKKGLFKNIAPGPVDAWMIYCWFLTICIPPFLLRACGMRTPERQRAWREKIGLMSLIVSSMAGVGFLTFGFNQTVCGTPPNRYLAGTIDKASIIIRGHDYDFSHFEHPLVEGVFDGKSNPLYEGGYNVAGNDLSFMFQYDHASCTNIIKAASGSVIPQSGNVLEWIFPCNPFNQFGTSQVNLTGYDNSTNCHMKTGTQTLFDKYHPSGQVYYSWSNVTNDHRNLVVYESVVLDLNLLNWLDTSLVTYPSLFDEFKRPNGTFNKRDVTMWVYRNGYKQMFQCLKDTIIVGFIDTKTIGCVASQVVLYVSLVVIIGVVAIRFVMAVIFGWFVSYKIGAFTRESYSQRMQRAAEIENWTDNIYRPAPSRYRPSVAAPAKGQSKGGQSSFLPTTSRFSQANMRPVTTYGLPEAPYRRTQTNSSAGTKGGLLSPLPTDFRSSRSSTSLPSLPDRNGSVCPWPLHNVVPQPPADYEPFNFPLMHTICLVTAYSESLEGLRTTLDSLATTDYPNSHKVILVVADGLVKGDGNSLTTPEIVLGMMKDLVVPIDEVEAHSYVAIADGHKRHNMAKVYAGFYDYDDNTVEPSKQQRVPIVLVAKTGNPLEASDPKPGNRGKRDSQMVLMAFLQKVMFDERMTTFEYEFFNLLWRCTGVSPDRYETVLCVDADTKVFPDSLTRMTACMVHDEDIMGLCGETKIANKSETWVTMIQVFEYYISHHLTKAFESMFGGVTCLPGCFSMYRIKAPKGSTGYWVPILANPDIIEHYSENIIDTLHKKNLLLLGEDRYLTTLMLKTFPKRKMIFCPQAVCKTIVPDTFSVLLSQRRRWINSTVHNLAELLLVRDLCGTFCFSMQFVVGMELMGTLVLPAAIAFTIYLIIQSIIPGGPSTTISLILLAIILGLPGLLIVITSRKVAYVGWMLVYLFSLVIWNFVLPTYAFWHFDDFSWGATRKALGDDDASHGDKQGEFDSSHIVMKRWAEFERERRWKGGMISRDSTYDVVYRNSSPKRAEHRYSLGSTAETYNDNASASRSSQQPMVPGVASRHDSLEAPRALGTYHSGGSLRDSSPSNSSDGFGATGASPGYGGGQGSPYDETEPMVPSYSRQQETPPHLRPGAQPAQPSGYFGQGAQSYDQAPSSYTPPAAKRHTQDAVPPPVQGLPRPANKGARRTSTQVPPVSTSSPRQASPSPASAPAQSQAARGFTLTDPGFVAPATSASNQNVRRVSRQSRRSSTTPATGGGAVSPAPPSVTSSSHADPAGAGRSGRRSTAGPAALPPGAAPPQYPRYGTGQ